MKNQNREQVNPARLSLIAAAAGALMLCTPGQAQDCGNVQLTQNLSVQIVEGAGIACAGGGITDDNSFARCYPPRDASFSVRCVDVGVEINTGSDLLAAVNIYVDADGCPPTHPDIDLLLVASESFSIPAGTFLELFEIELSVPVLINSGETLVVELDYPAHTDGGVWPGCNYAGATGPYYIRSEACGLITYAAMKPWEAWVQIVNGDVPCPADLDGDGSVGILDLLLLLSAWGTTPVGPPDFDGDGTVGILDLLTLLTNWGPCP